MSITIWPLLFQPYFDRTQIYGVISFQWIFTPWIYLILSKKNEARQKYQNFIRGTLANWVKGPSDQWTQTKSKIRSNRPGQIGLRDGRSPCIVNYNHPPSKRPLMMMKGLNMAWWPCMTCCQPGRAGPVNKSAKPAVFSCDPPTFGCS